MENNIFSMDNTVRNLEFGDDGGKTNSVNSIEIKFLANGYSVVVVYMNDTYTEHVFLNMKEVKNFLKEYL